MSNASDFRNTWKQLMESTAGTSKYDVHHAEPSRITVASSKSFSSLPVPQQCMSMNPLHDPNRVHNSTKQDVVSVPITENSHIASSVGLTNSKVVGNNVEGLSFTSDLSGVHLGALGIGSSHVAQSYGTTSERSPCMHSGDYHGGGGGDYHHRIDHQVDINTQVIFLKLFLLFINVF